MMIAVIVCTAPVFPVWINKGKVLASGVRSALTANRERRFCRLLCLQQHFHLAFATASQQRLPAPLISSAELKLALCLFPPARFSFYRFRHAPSIANRFVMTGCASRRGRATPDCSASCLFMRKTPSNSTLSHMIPFAEETELVGVAVSPAPRPQQQLICYLSKAKWL